MRNLLHKTTIIVLLLCAVAGVTRPVSADATDAAGDYLACRAIKGKAERLLCYDTITDGGVFDEEKLEQVQRETFGDTQKTPEVSIDQLGVTIVRVQKDTTGIRYFETADGQVWKQQDTGHYPSKVPFEAEIKSGMLGSFLLVKEGGRTVRIKRVK